MSLETFIEGLASKAHAATRGPWEAYRRNGRATGRTIFGIQADDGSEVVDDADLRRADAELMAVSRTAVPVLASALLDVLSEETARRLVASAHGIEPESLAPDDQELVDGALEILRSVISEHVDTLARS